MRDVVRNVASQDTLRASVDSGIRPRISTLPGLVIALLVLALLQEQLLIEDPAPTADQDLLQLRAVGQEEVVVGYFEDLRRRNPVAIRVLHFPRQRHVDPHSEHRE